MIFDQSNIGSGASSPFTVTFKVSGAQAAGEILVEGGRTYLLAVVAQVAIRIETTNSAGQHVTVRNGNFDTWGSLTGIVREICVNETDPGRDMARTHRRKASALPEGTR